MKDFMMLNNPIWFMTIAGAILGSILGALYSITLIAVIDTGSIQYASSILFLGGMFGLAGGVPLGFIDGIILDMVIRRFEFPLVNEQKFFRTLYAISGGLTLLFGIAGYSLLFPSSSNDILFNNLFAVTVPSIIAMCGAIYATKRLGQRVILQANPEKKKKSVA